MYVDWQTIVTAATVIAAVVAFGTYFTKLHNWILQQNKQDIDISGIKKELQITTYAVGQNGINRMQHLPGECIIGQ